MVLQVLGLTELNFGPLKGEGNAAVQVFTGSVGLNEAMAAIMH